jgi:hypothetical protein
MKIRDINNLLESTISKEIKKAILTENKEYYHVTLEGEPIETFETEEKAEEYIENNKDKHDGKELLIDKKIYNDYNEMIDDLDEMSDQISNNEKNENMKKSIKENIEDFERDYYDTQMDERYKNSSHPTFSKREKEVINKYSNSELEEENECMECGGANMEEMSDEFTEETYMDEMSDDYTEDTYMDETSNEYSESDSMGEMSNDYMDEDMYEIRDEYSEGDYMDEDMYEMQDEYSESDSMDEMSDEYTEDESIYEGYGMCNECGSMLNEAGMCMECGMGMNESKKRKIRLKESELISLIKKMVNESLPGMTVTEKSRKGSKKENDAHYGEVNKKMKKLLNFNDNDNPEFPHQVNSGTKVARHNTKSQEDDVNKNFAGLQNLEYDIEPSERFKERLKMAIEGHTHMGNATETPKPKIKPTNGAEKGKEAKEKSGNQVKTDTPKKIEKQVKDRKKDVDNRVIYKKEKVPVDTNKKKDKSVNESTQNNVLLEEINRMKKLSTYNKRTQ